jgi:3-deoxy-manno-octulosonate cytidylyltransferase (CMP-KDO synthetase)
VVPARYDSTRLPGKVLADLGGRPMLVHVWERLASLDCFDRVLIATDDDRVEAVARRIDAEVVRTGPARNGTHRAALAIGAADTDVVVVQADQPLLDPVHVRVLVDQLQDAPVATLAAPLEGDPADPARVKVALGPDGRAAAFSRRPIPEGGPYLVHLGLYGFRSGALARCVAAPTSPRAAEEDLEQVAWLDAGIRIAVAEVDRCPPSVDTPADLERVRRLLGRGSAGA